MIAIKKILVKILDNYKNKNDNIDCIFPLSGGRDSCYGLHLAVKELGVKNQLLLHMIGV